MSNIDLNKLSKIISHALRHQPSFYNLKLDKDGWVNVSLLIEAIKNKYEEYSRLSIIDIREIISSSKKKRHQIIDDKIRASYGHSLENKIIKKPSTPPKYLYHATKRSFIEKIFSKNLLPMQRQYVHLSESKSDAITG